MKIRAWYLIFHATSIAITKYSYFLCLLFSIVSLQFSCPTNQTKALC